MVGLLAGCLSDPLPLSLSLSLKGKTMSYRKELGYDDAYLNAGRFLLGDDEATSPEACPTCGCLPGEGLTSGCNDEVGCGFFRGSGDSSAV